jgi:hypothetical protein
MPPPQQQQQQQQSLRIDCTKKGDRATTLQISGLRNMHPL